MFPSVESKKSIPLGIALFNSQLALVKYARREIVAALVMSLLLSLAAHPGLADF